MSLAPHLDPIPTAADPAAQAVMNRLGALGSAELSRRQEIAQRMLRENGVAYNAFGDPREILQAWELDALPLLISSGEWQHVCAALEQRAKLLNLILADLY